jgi:L-alanine-DL-glutamate epimerase-like enolase superfamily enzyme
MANRGGLGVRIEAVDFFYLSMPEVTTAADGSQDALVVRVAAGGHIGWGECEAAPLPTIAAWTCPMSHGACRPVQASVLGQRLEGPADIAAMAAAVAVNSMDLLQAPHCWSGVEIALWDLLGRARGEPVWRLLGWPAAHPKLPYASVLFGATPAETEARARAARGRGFRAVKLGWAPFGADLAADAAHLEAARAGLGPDGVLLVDAGQVWGEDVEAAAARLPALEAAGATWLEEPFAGHAYEAYGALSRRSGVALAGGEAAHNRQMAEHLMAWGGVGYVQVDTGRIGGIGPAKAVADRAAARGVTYVNHTFTTSLALSASIQPYAGLAAHELCEFPAEPSALARELTTARLLPGEDGLLRLPEAPGLGVEPDPAALSRYAVEVEIRVGGRTLWASARP